MCPDLNVHACGWQFIRENQFNSLSLSLSLSLCVCCVVYGCELHFPLGFVSFAKCFTVLWKETSCSSKPEED